jgi:tyrosyl-tRNA synthetase
MPEVATDPSVISEVISSFARTTEQVVTLEEFRTSLASGRQLIMKYGVDVTAPDLHIGHAVNLWMYRRLQELGHKIIFLIGDFTTQIGDPTGKSKLRPIISMEEIQCNADAFISQAMLILHDDPATLEIRRNSGWLGSMSACELLSLMSLFTHDRLISRDMFRKRIAEGREIYEHEVIYPILQGYDSVMLRADLAIIGSDQLFNEMIGRDLQAHFGLPPQVVLTTKITPGIDGKEKQSKSLGNYIGLNHSPREKFGRIMSMPDELMPSYFLVYTDLREAEIQRLQWEFAERPMQLKLRLAREIVRRYHGEAVADAELAWFDEAFSKKHVPRGVPEVHIGSPSVSISSILQQCFAGSKSKSEISRLITQGAVTADGRQIAKPSEIVELPVDLKVGKRHWFRVLH